MPKTNHTVADVLQTAGFHEPIQTHSGTNWECWSANYLGPVKTTRESLLFLTGDCGWKDLEDAASWLRARAPRDTAVVVRNSARRLRPLDRVKRSLGTQDVFPITEFLYKFAQRALGNLDRSDLTDESFGLQYFTEPDVHFPEDGAPGPALEPLLRWLRGDTQSDSNIAVLLAPAAFGKSTLSEELFLKLRGRGNSIPVLIQRDQWAELAARESLQMEDIWSCAVRKCYPDALIGPAQLETFLRTGVLCPVFDGLDELCSLFSGHFNPTNTVEELITLFDDGRAIITSRTHFWEENIQEATKKRVLQMELRPFTPGQREEYLFKRFPDEARKRGEAKKILDRIAGKARTTKSAPDFQANSNAKSIPEKAAKFEGIPFVVMLTAESADTEETEVLSKYGALLAANDPVEGLLLAFCDRERLRHKLKINPSLQLTLFELLVVEFGPTFTRDELVLCLSDVGAPDDEHIRIANHALLRCSQNIFRFQYDFVEEYLIARRIKRWLSEKDGGASVGIRVFHSILRRPGSLIDRCAQLISADLSGWVTATEKKWKSFPDDPLAKNGFFSLMLGLVKRLALGGPQEHTEVLLEVFDGLPNRCFLKLDCRGPITGLDLRGILFEQCRFTNAEFANCTFDERTRFSQCTFKDQFAVTSCVDFHLVSKDSCTFSLQARGVFQREQGERNLPITQRQIVGAVRDALKHFQMGSAGFTTRKADSLRISLRHVPFRDRLLEVLEDNQVIERNETIGMERFAIGKTSEARIFLQNGMRIGRIRRAVDQLEQEFG